MRRRLVLALPLLLAPPWSRPAAAQSVGVRVLSAGAVRPGLEAAVLGFRAATGEPVHIDYATAPELRERLAAGATADLLIAPVMLVNELAAAGRLAGERKALGRVGIGAAMRAAAPAPDIRDMAGLRRALEEAERVVLNRATTGLHLERLFERLGLAATVAPKAVRYPTGEEVMHHLLTGSGREIGFAPVPEILQASALRFLGPLPPEAQGITTYAVSLMPGAAPAAAALLEHLTGPDGRAAFALAGVEPAP